MPFLHFAPSRMNTFRLASSFPSNPHLGYTANPYLRNHRNAFFFLPANKIFLFVTTWCRPKLISPRTFILHMRFPKFGIRFSLSDFSTRFPLSDFGTGFRFRISVHPSNFSNLHPFNFRYDHFHSFPCGFHCAAGLLSYDFTQPPPNFSSRSSLFVSPSSFCSLNFLNCPFAISHIWAKFTRSVALPRAELSRHRSLTFIFAYALSLRTPQDG